MPGKHAIWEKVEVALGSLGVNFPATCTLNLRPLMEWDFNAIISGLMGVPWDNNLSSFLNPRKRLNPSHYTDLDPTL